MDICADGDMMKYYNNLHGHYKEDNLIARRDTVMSSGSSMISYYRSIIYLTKSCIYSCFFMTSSDSLLQDGGYPTISLKLRLGDIRNPLHREINVYAIVVTY